MKSFIASLAAGSMIAGMARSTDADMLAELGLAGEAAPETAAEVATEVADEAEAATAPAKRVELKIVNPIVKKTGLLPALVRGGGGGGKTGSKYPFETLNAPTVADGTQVDEAGTAYPVGEVIGYDYFEIFLKDVTAGGEPTDEKKLSGAIQAAVAAQNKQNKKDGSAVKYVSRTLLDDEGAYAGTAVYRVDATTEDEDAK